MTEKLCNSKLFNSIKNLCYVLHFVQSLIFAYHFPSFHGFHQRDQILYNRHTRLTKSYLIDHTDPPDCIDCHQLLSVKHILTEFSSCDQTQQQYYVHTNNLKHTLDHRSIKKFYISLKCQLI